MGETTKQPHLWWLESHKCRVRSPWLQSTLTALDKKMKAMLKLIEEDADSFAQRAEMYYKKRPQLINMVEDFYRAHRSLAEQYDQVKSDSGSRLITTLGPPFFINKCQSEKSMSMSDGQQSDSYSETHYPEESVESDVDDPEQEDETQVNEEKVPHRVEENDDDEVKQLREEIERLKEENKIQKDRLLQKDEQKREVIRQLSLAVEVLKEENVNLRTHIAKSSPKKWSPFEFNKLNWGFWRNCIAD